MHRTVRLASLFRWTLIAMHTAMVVSAGILFATAGDSRIERAIVRELRTIVMLIDLPVTLVTLFPGSIVNAMNPSRAIWELLWAATFVLLGGLQWYWIASRLARWTCGFQKAIPIASRQFGIAVMSGLLLVGGCGFVPWTQPMEQARHRRNIAPCRPPTVAFSGDSKLLEKSTVVPTLDTPMPEGKNAIWCASFPMAWDRLKNDVITEPIRVANAEEVAERLNKAVVTDEDLPDGSYYSAAGFVEDGIADTIRREMWERFEKKPTDLDDKGAMILAYAYLRASVPFTLPYFNNDQEFHFTAAHGQKTLVSSFGLRQKDESKYLDLRDQVEVLYLKRNSEGDQPTEFALDVCRDSKPNQVILACIPRQGTIQATLDDLEQKMTDGPPKGHARHLGPNSTLLVPNLHWSIRHHFSELEGPGKQLLNAKFRGLWIATALQTIDFRLDRSGVELESESTLTIMCRDPNFHFDHPFLIIVKKRGAERPFFVMWVDNAELLSKP